MKKKFTAPELSIAAFDVEDIICTSGDLDPTVKGALGDEGGATKGEDEFSQTLLPR